MSDGVQALLTHIRQVGLPEPQTEVRFHKTRKWRFDLAWPDKMIAVEIDGAIWVRGRHSRGAGMEADNEKINEAQRLGFRVFRFSTGQVTSGDAITFLEQVMREA
jgi:very-short-patch-repair endonuclease